MDCRSYYYFEVHVSYCVEECNFHNKHCHNNLDYEINEVRKGIVKGVDDGFNLTCVIDTIRKEILREFKCNCNINHSSINISINNTIKITHCDYEKIRYNKDQYDICYILDCSKYCC